MRLAGAGAAAARAASFFFFPQDKDRARPSLTPLPAWLKLTLRVHRYAAISPFALSLDKKKSCSIVVVCCTSLKKMFQSSGPSTVP